MDECDGWVSSGRSGTGLMA